MQKEDIGKFKDAAESNCRVYFDQLSTLRQQEQQVATALEQERGKVRAYDELLEAWSDPATPEEDQHLAGMPATRSADTSSIPVPRATKLTRRNNA